MGIKKFAIALVAAFALTAIAASAAQATVWKVNGNALANGQSREVTVSKHAGANLVLSTKALGATLILEATGIEGEGAEIDQAGTVAHSRGNLVFTGVTVKEPKGCEVAPTLTTEPLEDEVVMGNTEATANNVYDLFKPKAGGTGRFISIKISGCAAANTYPVKGNVYGLAQHTVETEPGKTSFVNNLTGEEFLTQTLTFSEPIQKSQGGTLRFGTEPAFLSGSVDNRLTLGGEFGAE
jgi:hypothetical protein